MEYEKKFQKYFLKLSLQQQINFQLVVANNDLETSKGMNKRYKLLLIQSIVENVNEDIFMEKILH